MTSCSTVCRRSCSSLGGSTPSSSHISAKWTIAGYTLARLAHNAYLAELDYGKDVMDRYRRRGGRVSEPAPSYDAARVTGLMGQEAGRPFNVYSDARV
jgi:hypothetical protein